MSNMSDPMHAALQMEVSRALREHALAFGQAIHTNRGASTVPTQTVSRVIRVHIPSTSEYRAWTLAVSLTEIASGSVAGASPAASDDITI